MEGWQSTVLLPPSIPHITAWGSGNFVKEGEQTPSLKQSAQGFLKCGQNRSGNVFEDVPPYLLHIKLHLGTPEKDEVVS